MIGTKFAPKPWARGSDAVMTACRNSMDRLGMYHNNRHKYTSYTY
jgi:hypothetical protein